MYAAVASTAFSGVVPAYFSCSGSRGSCLTGTFFSREVAFQKLRYIHNNPLAGHWQLVKDPCDYKYSSARYYELNKKNFSFLKDLWEVF